MKGWTRRLGSRQSGRGAELVEGIGEPELDEALSEILRVVDEALPHAELGFYLHGSAAEGSRSSASDIDVLAVGNAGLLLEDEAYAKRLAREVAERRSLPIDFHILPVRELAADPYVQLRRVGRFLGGHDRRAELPEPTTDAAARESVHMSCLLMCSALDRLTPPLTHPDPDDEFFGRLPEGAEPRRFAKTLAWLTSGLLASRHGDVPLSASDAIRRLSDYEPELGPKVVEAFVSCREEFGAAVPADAPGRARLRACCALTFELENLVFQAFLDSTTGRQPHLGPRGGQAIRNDRLTRDRYQQPEEAAPPACPADSPNRYVPMGDGCGPADPEVPSGRPPGRWTSRRGARHDAPMVPEELIAEVSGVVRRKLVELDSTGWQFEVMIDRPEHPGVALSVEFTHPLVPYVFSRSIGREHLDTAAERIASWMEHEEEFQLIALSSSAVREERIPLLQGLRGALIHPDIARAVESVGWILFEQGILTRQEMDWLSHSFSGEWARDRQRVSQAWVARRVRDEG